MHRIVRMGLTRRNGWQVTDCTSDGRGGARHLVTFPEIFKRSKRQGLSGSDDNRAFTLLGKTKAVQEVGGAVYRVAKLGKASLKSTIVSRKSSRDELAGILHEKDL